jgi:glutamate synthase domain-containing protein 1
MFLFKNKTNKQTNKKPREKEGQTSLFWRLVPVRAGRIKGKAQEDEYGGNIIYLCMKIEK